MNYIKHSLKASAALLLCHAMLMAGTTGKISGRITDAASGDPLPGANVVIQGTTLGAATDAAGDYFIINVPPGTYSVEVTMIGYQGVTKTGAIVRIDLTTPLDYQITSTVLVGESVEVTAEREIIQMDQSASVVNASVAEIEATPLVNDIEQYISLQAGIEGDVIRGGGLDQTGFMLDGLMMVDNRANQPMMAVNLSSVQEISIIMGGFNAEYGNVRSGLINVTTKEGDPNAYHGSVDFRYTPPYLKHGGVSLFDPENWYLKRFLDPAVAFVGTENGTWDDATKAQYPFFSGWNKVASDLNEGLTPDDGLYITPQEAQQIFLWEHRVQNAEEYVKDNPELLNLLQEREGHYADKPDMIADVSLGGPVPVLNRYLGDLSFFVSHRTNREQFGMTTSRDFYREQNTQIKLTSRITSGMKLHLEGSTGIIESVNRVPQGSNSIDNNYVRGGDGIFDSQLGGYSGGNWGNYYSYGQHHSGNLYWPEAHTRFDIKRSMAGLALDHMLSNRTFYNLRLSYVEVKNDNDFFPEEDFRDPATLITIAGRDLNEAPLGMDKAVPPTRTLSDGMFYSATGGGARDFGKVYTTTVKFDLTSQVDKYNQVKAGFLYNIDNLHTWFEHNRFESTWENRMTKWDESPYRIGAYIQDKLEFEGMIANFGLRLDYNQPNTDWFDINEAYSDYYRKGSKDDFYDEAPQKPAEGHLKISPRLGISHPISDKAKLYFNYGHFYSMPPSSDMYYIYWGRKSDGVKGLGNPNAVLPRTVAYELGIDYNLGDMFLIHAAGYYKDVGDETGTVEYTGYDGGIDYETIENNHYADIRGLEVRVDKRFGPWFTGWLLYDYKVTTDGFVGREHYYEDQREQRVYGLQNPYQEKPLARPLARANLTLMTPLDFGPAVGGFMPLADINLSFLWGWKAGAYVTWDPLETDELEDNVQWKGRHTLDVRLSKRARLGGQTLTFWVDISNALDLEYIDPIGFYTTTDREKYLESLHLPMYKGQKYKEAGYTGGDDQLGDIGGPGTDKDYINMPDRDFLTYLNPRSFIIGLKYAF